MPMHEEQMTAEEELDLRREIHGMKADHSQMISEFLDAQQRRIKCTAWKDIADRTKARYERLEKMIQ